jgi:protein-S-isoprenylcysteine O-methyltransferase Ste14
MKRLVVVMIIFLVAGLIGAFCFSDISLQKQASAAQGLLNAGITLFAILGVWIAVLDPSRMLDKLPDQETSEREKLAQDLLFPWIAATLIFALSFVLVFVIHLFPVELNSPWILRIFGFFITFLFFCILYILTGTMLPVARLRYRQREKNLRKQYRAK